VLRIKLIGMLLVLSGLFTTVYGDLSLSVDQTTLRMNELYAWTVRRASYDGILRFDPVAGCQQGSVIRIYDGIEEYWCGGYVHGNEEVLSTSLMVDGISQPVGPNSIYVGDEISFTRVTELGHAVRLESTVTVFSDSFQERVCFSGLDASIDVVKAYGFLYAPLNTYSHFAAFDYNGYLLHEGITPLEDGSIVYSYLDGSSTVAQYSPETGHGMISRVTSGLDLFLSPFITDRNFDNKLYFRFMGMEKFASPSTYLFDISMVTTFFEADPLLWKDDVTRRIAFAGDCNLDGYVDGADLATIGLHWSPSSFGSLWGDGDFDGDLDVDGADLAIIGVNWSPVGNGIPEPTTIVFLGIGFICLMRRHR